MDNQPVEPGISPDQDIKNAALRAEADKSLASAYEAVADYIKELKAEAS